MRCDRRLSPHEAEDLDVILLGHSLGGILAADVALMQEDEKPKHRILGLVNFDAPFLGLHPRVIPTGIMGSIPRKDIPEDKLAGEQESLGLGPTYKPVAPSPNFDPPFTNDVRLAERGFLKGMMHFVNKNTDNLSRSIFDRIVSPVKFANCVNNYSELRRRHRRLIALENAELSPDRVRFVNYYTTSTGRYPRKGKPKPKTDEALEQMDQITISSSQERSATPSIFSEAETTTATTMTSESANDDHEPALKAPSEVSLVIDESELEPELDSEKTIPSLSPEITSTESIPSLDQKESPPDSDKAPDTLSPPSETAPTPKHKLRKFILLPSNHWRYNDNSHWTPILMEDMDEVLAHQSMFIPQGANYDFLVGDTVALIEQWVQSDLSRRLLQESLD